MSARVFLMADRGNGRVLSFGALAMYDRGATVDETVKSTSLWTDRQQQARYHARAWWLVEAASADAARECIAAERNEGREVSATFAGVTVRGPAVCNRPGRILASGGAR